MASRLEAAKKFGADHVIDVGSLGENIDQVRKLPRRRRRGDRGLRGAGCHPAGLADAAHRRPVCARGLVNPVANVTIDANMLVKRWVTMRGIHNYHPRHLIQALDFVMTNRGRFPFKEIVDSKFALKDLDAAFKKASERTVLCSPAHVPQLTGDKLGGSLLIFLRHSAQLRGDCSRFGSASLPQANARSTRSS